jgi:outer membrane protein TolC
VPSSATERVIELSLQEAIRLALEYNLVIQRERLSPQIAHTQVVQERAAFDPVGGADVQVSETKDLPTTRTLLIDSTGNIVGEQRIRPFSHRDDFTPRWQHKVLLGGNYEIRFINSRQDVSPSQFGPTTRQIADPRYESRVELSFTQPLLRDFGIAVNTAFIRQAEQGELIAEQQVVQAILDTLFAVQQRYWELVFRVQDLEVKRESQQLAEQFLAENKLRVELGLLPPVELIQAEARIKTRQADTIRAAAAVRTAEDQLKVVLNVLGMVGTWQVRIRPTDQPSFTPLVAISLEAQVALALKKRPDFVRSQLEVATREIARDFARNQRLPRLDIVSRFSVQAFGEGFDESTGRLRNAEGYAWAIGLRFEQPLGNRFANSELLKRELELRQTLMDQQQLLLTIVQEVAQAIRDIETFKEEVEVTRAGTALARAQLEAEQEKFRLGLTTSFNVLELQEDLSIARTDETRVLSDYNVALARLDQLTGKLQYDAMASTTK